jgi:hypothetical protein
MKCERWRRIWLRRRSSENGRLATSLELLDSTVRRSASKGNCLPSIPGTQTVVCRDWSCGRQSRRQTTIRVAHPVGTSPADTGTARTTVCTNRPACQIGKMADRFRDKKLAERRSRAVPRCPNSAPGSDCSPTKIQARRQPRRPCLADTDPDAHRSTT